MTDIAVNGAEAPSTNGAPPEPTSNGDPPDDPLSQINELYNDFQEHAKKVKPKLNGDKALLDKFETEADKVIMAHGPAQNRKDPEHLRDAINDATTNIDKLLSADSLEFTETETAQDTGNSAEAEVQQEPEAEAADKPAPRPPSEHQTKMVELIARQKDLEPVAGSVLVGELNAAKKAAKKAVRKGAGNAEELVSTYAKAVARVVSIVADLESPNRNERRQLLNQACPCGSGRKFKNCHGKRPPTDEELDEPEPADPSEMHEKLREHFRGMHRRDPFGRWRTAKELKELAEQKPDPIIVTVKGRNVIVHQRNTIVCGKPGSGKTWIALFAAINAVLGGGRVVIFNHEEGHAQGTARLQERLQLLCPNVEKWWDSILVVEPAQWTAEQLEEIREISIEWLNGAEVKANSLVVLDSISRAGGAVNDANEFNEWWNINIEPWAGFGVICVAHESKIDPRGPLGSVAAMAFFDTVLRVKCARGQSMWTSETEGCITVYVLKDRHSDSGKSSGDKVAVIIGAPTDGHLQFTIKDVEHLPDADEPPPPRDLKAEIIDLLKANDGTYTQGFKALMRRLGCKQTLLRKALDELISEGKVEETPHGNSYHYMLIGG